MNASLDEQFRALPDNCATILCTAAKTETDHRKFQTLCRLYFPNITGDEARQLQKELGSQNNNRI
jgi:hypothetical protein